MAIFHMSYALTWALAFISLVAPLVSAGKCIEIETSLDVGFVAVHNGRMWADHKKVCDETKKDDNGKTSFKCDDGFSLKYEANDNPESGATAWLTFPGQDEVEVDMKKYNEINTPACAGGNMNFQTLIEFEAAY